MASMPKVLVTNTFAYPELIDFMSNYRTRDHMHGDDNYKYDDTKKYYPKGTLMWFPCDTYGDRIKDPPIFIKYVPDNKHRRADDGKRVLEAGRKARKSLVYLLTKEEEMPLEYDNYRYKFYHNPIRGNGGNENEH